MDSQGHSPFVWSVIGGIAAVTGLEVTTAVTCPILRIHPAVLAQAAATSSVMLEGRFRFGVGSGERLNEHVLGQHWPPVSVRHAMLDEAVDVMRELWKGEVVTRHGTHYTVENARIYTAPAGGAIPVIVSAFGPEAAALAGRIGDGLMTTSPDADAIAGFRQAGGTGPTVATVKICWGPDEQEAKRTAHRLWRSSGVPGESSQELSMPQHFGRRPPHHTARRSRGRHPRHRRGRAGRQQSPAGPRLGEVVVDLQGEALARAHRPVGEAQQRSACVR